MRYFNEEGAVVIKSWCDNPEDGAIEQAKNVARLPFAFKQVCLMPDTHQGYGVPIGCVLATQKYIVPNATGNDIGCGMRALRTSLSDISVDSIKEIMSGIRKAIPLGKNRHKEAQSMSLMPTIYNLGLDLNIVRENYQSALESLGTLGGGNHFLEIQRGSDGYIWIMLHSGSRNLGSQVATYYNKKAVELNERYFSQVPTEHELAFLPVDSKYGQAYVAEMSYCVEYASANRGLMATRVKEIFTDVVKDVQFGDTIDVAHNYARLEHHFGKNLVIHRKGATSAKEDELGLIPGSLGSCSYIVVGLGDEESFQSCSHGAGRKLSRRKAIETLDLEKEIRILNNQGVIHGVRGKDDLAESTGSYKDINEVMKNQEDLVKIVTTLKPIASIKS